MAYSLPASVFADALLQDLLAVSLTAVVLLRPLYSLAGEVEDFALDYLNPAAQRMTGLAEQPAGTARTLFPASATGGILGFYRGVFETGEAGRYEFNYQADGFDNYFRVAARRSGELLVVSFTDTSDQDRSPVEEALRQSQAREQAARAEAETQRALAQGAQRETEAQRQRLHDFMSVAPGVVLSMVGPQHVIEFANEGFRQQFSVADPVGKPYREAVPTAADQHAKEYQDTDLYDHIYRTGEPYYAAEAPYYVDPTHAGQGELHYFTFSVQAARDGSGQIAGVQVYAFDVTEQVVARRQVEELNQVLEVRVQERAQDVVQAQAETDAQRLRLHQLVAQAPALIASLRGPEHVVELANEGFRAIFGGRDMVGKTYREAIPEFESQPFFDLLDAVYRTGETYSGIDELVILDRTNSGQLEHTYITFTYQATRDSQGQIDGILIFCYEVTDQVLARQEREAQRRQLEQLFMQFPAPIVILNGPTLVYDLVNPSYQQIFPGRVLQGKALLAALPELADTPIPDIIGQVYNTGETFTAQELPLRLARHADGPLEEMYWTFTYQARRNAHGAVDGVLVFAYEVTEQVQIRAQVQNLNEELAAINEALRSTNEELGESNTQLLRTNADLDTFVYAASHDLKAPITNIEGLLDALRAYLPGEGHNPMVPRLLSMMQDAISRFQQTVGHLTDIASLQHTPAAAAEALDLARVLDDVRLDLLPLLESTQAELLVDVTDCPYLYYPAKNLRSILFNLVSNAVKYRAPNRPPRVRVRVQRADEPGVVLLEVQDNGLGLDERQQGQLFTMFKRLHTHVEGSGVGLYLIKRLIENADGTITVRSQPGVGSTFTVTLPRA